jgi:excisionase family DNA binding protein
MLTLAPPPTPESDQPLLLSVATVARMLGISQRFVWTMIERDELPHRRLGRRVLVPRAALEALAAGKPHGGSAAFPQLTEAAQ